MSAPDGGFYASQDADSEGEEGVYYVWTPEQIDAVLGPEAGAALLPGLRRDGARQLRARHQRARRRRARAARALRRRARGAARRAREARAARDRPQARRRLECARDLGPRARRQPARRRGDARRRGRGRATSSPTRMRDGAGRLARVWNEGRARVPAFLDDLAALARGDARPPSRRRRRALARRARWPRPTTSPRASSTRPRATSS